jgi:hypothetical protein
MANYDPYAPPVEPSRDEERNPLPRGVSDYAGERRPVVLLILLSVVTLGIYPIIWLFRRRAFLDSLDSDAKLGNIPTVVAVMYGTDVGIGVWSSMAKAGEGLDRLVQIAAGITMLIAVFRVAHILRSDFARSGRFIGVSGVMVFFFGTLYLQYKMNQAADTSPLKKRKKKKKKPVEDAPAPDDHSSSSNQPGQ